MILYVIPLVVVSVLGSSVGNNLDNKVIGGHDTTIERYPYQVLLMRKDVDYLCGGSIFSRKHVLTAAHCTEGITVYNLFVRAGSTRRDTGGNIYSIIKIINHEHYDSRTTDNDISIVTIKGNFVYGPRVQPIKLATFQAKAGDWAIVTGWGIYNANKDSPLILQSLKIPISDWDECRLSYMNARGGITNNMLCAGDPENEQDACPGDSGGPLVAHGQLIGVVSWGGECDKILLHQLPGVYTNVFGYREWIEKQIKRSLYTLY